MESMSKERGVLYRLPEAPLDPIGLLVAAAGLGTAGDGECCWSILWSDRWRLTLRARLRRRTVSVLRSWTRGIELRLHAKAPR
jgi:hypothetical protein